MPQQVSPRDGASTPKKLRKRQHQHESAASEAASTLSEHSPSKHSGTPGSEGTPTNVLKPKKSVRFSNLFAFFRKPDPESLGSDYSRRNSSPEDLRTPKRDRPGVLEHPPLEGSSVPSSPMKFTRHSRRLSNHVRRQCSSHSMAERSRYNASSEQSDVSGPSTIEVPGKMGESSTKAEMYSCPRRRDTFSMMQLYRAGVKNHDESPSRSSSSSDSYERAALSWEASVGAKRPGNTANNQLEDGKR